MGEIIFNDKPAPGEYLEHHKYIRREGTKGNYRYYYPPDLKNRNKIFRNSPEKGTIGYRDRGTKPTGNASRYWFTDSSAGRNFANGYRQVMSSAMIKAAKKNYLRGLRGKTVGNPVLDRLLSRYGNYRINRKFIKTATKGYSKN